MKTIGARLKAERERLGFTQTKMAELGCVKRSSQANYEADKRSPAADYMQGVAAYGVDIQFVITGVKSLNMKDVIRAGMEDFEVQFTPLVEVAKGIDLDLLKGVTTEVLNAIKRHEDMSKLKSEDIAEAIAIIYNNYKKSGKRPRKNDPSILSAVQLSQVG